MYAMSQVDFTNKSTVDYTVTAYACVQACIWSLYAYLYLQIQAFERRRNEEYSGREQQTFVVKAPEMVIDSRHFHARFTLF